MRLGASLLVQARYLLRHEPRRPRQATLRRAVSTAYYALFHLLTEESAHSLITGTVSPLQELVCRAYDHSVMRQACRSYDSGGLPPHIAAVTAAPPNDLRAVASAFAELQDARHNADYNVSVRFTRQQAEDFVILAEEAFTAWERVRKTPEARVFLVSLLLWRQWNRS